MTIHAPRVAAKCHAGQFFMLRVDERGERVPFTFSDWSRDEGWIRFIFMVVGKTTSALAALEVGECVHDLAGPLGKATDVPGTGSVVVVGGGVGTAVAYPVARSLCEAGREVRVIVGARTADLLILIDELDALPLAELRVMTDDGTAGEQGLVTVPLAEMCTGGNAEQAFIVGPAIMMKFAALTAVDAGVPATVSLNPLMVDGTGMCGACRVSVDGVTRFACVDGPDFCAEGVDWDELMSRQRFYLEEERASREHWERAERAGRERLHDRCDCFEQGGESRA